MTGARTSVSRSGDRDQMSCAIALIERRWTLDTVHGLASGPMRFVELRDSIGASNESLRMALKNMTKEDLVARVAYREFPPRVEYSLTERGRDLLPVVMELAEWANNWEPLENA